MTTASGAPDHRNQADVARLAPSVEARLAGVRPVRADLVVRLRKQLAEGHYAPPAEQVADRLVGPLLSRQPRITRWHP